MIIMLYVILGNEHELSASKSFSLDYGNSNENLPTNEGETIFYTLAAECHVHDR